MAKIIRITRSSESAFFVGEFVDDDGRVFEIVFVEDRDHNIGFSQIELVNVELDSKPYEDTGLWRRIEGLLRGPG